ncbi:MAG: hypothetical protein CMO80_22330 [Verrucomicrobiales bacterium]|nr:hypothetical protein [Verrucomicrobiales bacterium]
MIDIGSRRELFVDHHLIEKLDGARLELRHPVPREVVISHDEPWEGNGCGFHSIFKDGDRYRMYYKSYHFEVGPERTEFVKRHFLCYAESDDGVHWRKPDLGLHEFEGSRKNNIVIAPHNIGHSLADPSHSAVFKDPNPNAPAESRYKAIIRGHERLGMLAFQSPDGLSWTPMRDRPVITKGAFDSQNLAFWDPVRGEYRAYFRTFTKGVTNDEKWKPAGIRAIRTATSDNFVDWKDAADLTYVDSPDEHLYTNQIKPYHRAPHIFIGFPTRYVERGWSESMHSLPEPERRQWRARAGERFGMALTEGLIMSSRDGVQFHRWNEAFLRPGAERPGSWLYGDAFIGWHIVETASALAGAPNELSIYASQGYWHGKGNRLRRYTLRLDGFVSVSADWKGGQLLTRPMVFDGDQLEINFATSAAGSLRVEVQNLDGTPAKGFSLADCAELFGDAISRRVIWKSKADLSALAGKPVRLRFDMKDADLYSFRFKK